MDEIKPALTPEEWERPVASSREPAYVRPDRVPGYVAFDTNLVGDEPIVFPAEQVLAIANAALADDSPHKITRQDVDLVIGVALTIDLEFSGFHERDARSVALESLAGKLAALLPPE